MGGVYMRWLLFLLFTALFRIDLIQASAQESSPHFSADAQVALGAYRGIVEEHIAGIRRTLRVVADSAEAKSASWEQCGPLLRKLSDDLSTDATAWFALPDGSYSATEVGGETDQNLKDRQYFPALMSGKEVFGDLVISKSTGHRSVIVAVPVVTGGKAIAAVGVSLRVRLLSQLVDTYMPLPANAYFYALERDTRIVIHRKAERMFQPPSDVGDEALGEEFKRLLAERKAGHFEYTLHGKKMAAIFELSPGLGWYFFIAKEI
jgi:methyl-accepting chemotaxis protein